MARKSRKHGHISESLLTPSSYQAGVYTRLSDEDQTSMEDNSIGNQRKICMDFAEKINNLTVVKFYTDNGFTGTNFRRDGFGQMMDDIENGLINCVIVKDLSRLGREYIGASELIERLFPAKSIRFIAVNNHYDSADLDGTKSGIVLPVTNIANDFYSKDISRKIRSAIQTKMQTGSYLPSSGAIPYGYIRGSHSFIVDEETRDIVIRIYQMRSKHMAYHAIAHSLNEEHVPSPGYLRYIRGITKKASYAQALWNSKSIREILKNQVYLGHQVHGKMKRERLGDIKKRTGTDTWIYQYNAHEPIITQELFDQVQQINEICLNERASFGNGGELKEDYRQILLGKLICGDCGGKMTSVRRNQRKNSPLPPVINYQCYQYQQYRNQSRCFNHYIPEQEILKYLEDYLNIRLSIIPDLEKLVKKKQYNRNFQTALNHIHKEQKDYEEKQARLWQDFSDQLLDREEYLYAKEQYEKHSLELSKKEEHLRETLEKEETLVSEARKWIDYLKTYQKIRKLDSEIIRLLIKEIRVFGNRRLEIIMNFRDPLLEEYWLGCQGKEELHVG